MAQPASGADRRQKHEEERRQTADRTDPEGEVEPDRLADRSTDQSPERDRTPDDPSHRSTHPPLQAFWGDCLAKADLRDGVDDHAD